MKLLCSAKQLLNKTVRLMVQVDRLQSRLSKLRSTLCTVMQLEDIDFITTSVGGKQYQARVIAEHERIYITPTEEVLNLLEENGILYHVTTVKPHVQINQAQKDK